MPSVTRDGAGATPRRGRPLALASLLAVAGCSSSEPALHPSEAGEAPRGSGLGADAPAASREDAAGGDGVDAVEEVVDYCADAGGRGDGSTFADLYRDFFGPTGL